VKKALAAMATLFALASLRPSSRVHTVPRHPGMVLVPAGPFVMGLSAAEAESAQRAYGGDASLYLASVPRRVVALPAFWVDRTEVTQRMYHAFVLATGHPPPDDDHLWAAPYRWQDGAPPPALAEHPVTLVTFEDAEAYCHWRGMQVPTEEQWEKAARGTDGRAYPWGEGYAADRLAGAEQRSPVALARIEAWTEWWRTTYRGRMRGREVGTFPVGRFPRGASPYGALDMAGNVFEWVDAFFDPYPGAPAAHPHFGQGYRVVRGGDWYLDRIYHHTAMRLRAPADHRVPTIGFRCVCARLDDRHEAVGKLE
jgi:formylglycine-generating enzyme required for sulfatase activity